MQKIPLAAAICFTLSLALLLPACSSDDQDTAQSPATKPEVEWGKMVNGLQSGLRFGLQARAYRMGELVDFVLLVRNTGDKTVTLVDYIPLTGWAPTVRTVDGKSLPIAVPAIDTPVQVRKRVLKPGDILEVGTVFLQLDAGPEERGQTPHVHLTPGKYLVSQAYRFADKQETTWSGELTTGELTLSVAAADKPSEIEVPAPQPEPSAGSEGSIDTMRDEYRKVAEEATSKGDYAIAKRNYTALLFLPEPPLQDCRAAIGLFEQNEDWPALADAYEISAEAMWRVIHMPANAFIRPVPEEPIGSSERSGISRGNRSSIQVQTNLDGVWSNCKGEAEHWIDWIQRKQNELRQKRIEILKKLGKLCLTQLDSPPPAVAAYEVAGRGIPLCTEPLEKLIPQMWPKMKLKAAEVLALDQTGAASIRLEILDGLAEAQIAAGDIRSASYTRLRGMLAMLISEKGDWNAHGSISEAEKFWHLARQLPPDAPLPPMLWLNVLDRNHPELDFPAPEEGPHGLPYSFPGPNLVIRPGHKARTLTVLADMETPGGRGGVRCFTRIDGKVHDLGSSVQWHRDGRKGREWRTGTFDVPEDVGIIRLRITPASGSDFHVRDLKVRATFAPSLATQPATQE